MSIENALARLYALATRGARHGLDPMRIACAAEGDPQDRLTSVHVAGTNGKGSVAATIEAIARASGLRTGLYTSPHLGRFAERIRIAGASIEDDHLARLLERVLDAHPDLTFFEVATLAAFHAFHEARVELAIFEVGLGGRLDATNVIARPRVTAVTTIGYDHTAILGETIEAIAREKAGVLKPFVPVVTGPLPRAAASVIEARAQQETCPALWRVGEELLIEPHEQHLVVHGPAGRSIAATPVLQGAHQANNAAIAVGVAWLLRTPPGNGSTPPLSIEDVDIARGLSQVRWPGRLEEVAREVGPFAGVWLLDGAHNEEGARALAAALDLRAEPIVKRALVFGAMADKAWGTMLRELAPRFGTRVYVEPVASGGGRAATSAQSLVELDAGSRAAPTVGDAMEAARAAVGRNGLVVVAGSLYLVGDVRARLLGSPTDPHVGL